jgi:hypothetical protein
MKLRKPYINKIPKDYSDLVEFFEQELSFSSDDNKDNVILKYEYEINSRSRVWLLFASKDCENWECLQVAQSKNNVSSEVKDVIQYIFSNLQIDYESLEKKNSLFYEKVRPVVVNGYSYREVLYSYIGKQFKYFKICFLNVDKYLNITPRKVNDTDEERMIEICKNQYAEAKIAYETLAVYWMQYNPGIDGQTIAYIAEHEKEFL